MFVEVVFSNFPATPSRLKHDDRQGKLVPAKLLPFLRAEINIQLNIPLCPMYVFSESRLKTAEKCRFSLTCLLSLCSLQSAFTVSKPNSCGASLALLLGAFFVVDTA